MRENSLTLKKILAPYLFIVYLDFILRNISRSNERKWSHTKQKRQEAYIIPPKQSQMQTMHSIKHFSQMPMYKSKMSAAETGTGRKSHWSPCELR